MSIDAPRSRARAHGGFEMQRWVFMRMSGLLLVVLALGHLLVMNVLDGGVARVNWGFVAGRWASPLWRTWDLLTLWLAELHGTIGLRTVIDDYAVRPATRFWLRMVLYASALLVVTLGSLVVLTFDPGMR